MTELDPRDRELAAILRETLEQKASSSDPLLDAALAATRARVAAGPARRHTSWWLAGGFALAASLAVVVVLPQGGILSGTDKPASVEIAMPDADLQFLESMDMLVAMQ